MGDYYDFSELPTVVKSGKKYIVYDGNRRISILKCLQDNALYERVNGGLVFPDDYKFLKEQTEIPCNVCDKETALINTQRKHANNGTWKPLERDYFLHIHRGQSKTPFIFLEEQTGYISKYPKFNQTFVDKELFKNHKINKIGIHFDSNESRWVSNYDKLTTENIFSKISELLESKIINNQSVRNKERLIENILIENFPELENIIKPFDTKAEINVIDIADKHSPRIPKPRINEGETADTQEKEDFKENISEELIKSTQKINPKSTSRNYLIPKNCKIYIQAPTKLNNIYRELREDLPLDSAVNAAAVLFRVFLECSIDHFWKIKKPSEPFPKEKKLVGKITKVADELKSLGLATDDQLVNIRKVGNNNPSILSIDNFHQYVHNSTVLPVSDDLKLKWDNLQEFFEILWSEINKK